MMVGGIIAGDIPYGIPAGTMAGGGRLGYDIRQSAIYKQAKVEQAAIICPPQRVPSAPRETTRFSLKSGSQINTPEDDDAALAFFDSRTQAHDGRKDFSAAAFASVSGANIISNYRSLAHLIHHFRCGKPDQAVPGIEWKYFQRVSIGICTDFLQKCATDFTPPPACLLLGVTD